jgi:hypothetical protein
VRDAARILVVLLVIAVTVIIGLLVTPLVFPCSGEERAVFKEFPHYGDAKPEVESDIESGGCVVRYDTGASQEQVARYYMKQLKAHGWKAERSLAGTAFVEPTEPALKEPERKKVSLIGITARRGEFYYEVNFETNESVGEPGSGGLVALHLYEGR